MIEMTVYKSTTQYFRFWYAMVRNYLMRRTAWGLYWALRIKLSICFVKVNTPKRVTSSLDWTQVKLIFNICLSPRIISWNFPWSALKEFNLNHFNMFFVVHIKPSLILGRSFPHEYTVLSSAKLQVSDFSTEKKILSIKYIKQ